MQSNEFLAVIKADREREIKAALRARSVDRRPLDEEPDARRAESRVGRIGRLFRPSAQPGEANPGSSS